jgi:uncharacterized membrane protein (DUF106 family)
MVLENIFILKIHPFWAILIISFVITLVTTLVYKFTTDQKKMKQLKAEMKEYQKKIKAMSKESPEKAMALQQQAMKHNMEYMKSSFKSTLYTFIPIILIFGWLNAHFAYLPIQPNQPFNVTAYFAEGHASIATLSTIPDLEIIGNTTQMINQSITESGFLSKKTYDTATWQLKGTAGEYNLIIDYNDEKYDKDSGGKPLNMIITSDRIYASPEKGISNSKLVKIVVGNEKLYPLKDILGWKISWIWVYIILSFGLSLGLRKALNVY